MKLFKSSKLNKNITILSFILFFFIYFIMFFLCIIFNNYIFWWRIFLLMTLIFVILNKSLKRINSLFNYFIIQETLGLFFLLLSYSFFQFIFVILKIGVAPLHFWIFNVLNNISGINLIWFLTFQKIPFLIILSYIFSIIFLLLILFGVIICYYQIFSLKNYKNIILVSSTESFNWVILGFFLSFFNVLFLFFYYIFNIIIILFKYNMLDNLFLDWEVILTFINLPFRVNFFIKIFSLREILKVTSIIPLFLLFLIFLSSLSIIYLLVNLSVKDIMIKTNNYNLFFILFSTTIFLVI